MASLKKEKFWSFNIFKAYINDNDKIKDLGYLSTVNFGEGTIYLTGTRTKLGDKFHTSYSLIWEAILHAKKDGCDFFDLGGLNELTNKGVYFFKSGLNGKNYELVGEWRYNTYSILNVLNFLK